MKSYRMPYFRTISTDIDGSPPSYKYMQRILWSSLIRCVVDVSIVFEDEQELDKECPRCRTQRGYLTYCMNKYRFHLKTTDNILGIFLWKIHQSFSRRTPWCQYDFAELK